MRSALAVPYNRILRDLDANLETYARNVLPPLAYDSLPRRRYGPAAAGILLDRAGWRRGADGSRTRDGVRLAFTLATVAGFTGFERIGLLLQSSLKTVGVELAIRDTHIGSRSPRRTVRFTMVPMTSRYSAACSTGTPPLRPRGLRLQVPARPKHLSVL